MPDTTITMASGDFDLTKPSSYEVKLGKSMTNPTRAPDILTSVRYNQKPELADPANATGSVRSVNGTSHLELRDGNAKWSYEGAEMSSSSDHLQCILVPSADGKILTLERLDSVQEYNLVKSPNYDASEELFHEHPRLASEGEQDGAADDTDGSGSGSELDPENPYDWRNHIRDRSSSSASPPSATAAALSTARPAAKTQPGKTTAVASSRINLPETARQPLRPPKPTTTSVKPLRQSNNSKQPAAKKATNHSDPRGDHDVEMRDQSHQGKVEDIIIELDPIEPETEEADDDNDDLDIEQKLQDRTQHMDELVVTEDDNDDLETQLLEAMEKADEGPEDGIAAHVDQPQAVTNEEEEESEEE